MNKSNQKESEKSYEEERKNLHNVRKMTDGGSGKRRNTEEEQTLTREMKRKATSQAERRKDRAVGKRK